MASWHVLQISSIHQDNDDDNDDEDDDDNDEGGGVLPLPA